MLTNKMTGYYLGAVAALIVIIASRRPWRRREDNLKVMEAWLDNFSPHSYLPMLRLADSGDTGYLNIQRGPMAAARYRRIQREILKDYVRGLSRDFHRLHALGTDDGLRRIHHENSALALVDEKLEFIFSVWSIELRLLIGRFAPCAVNLQPLLANVDELTAKARETARRRLEYRLSS
jgi:hypothetical protein